MWQFAISYHLLPFILNWLFSPCQTPRKSLSSVHLPDHHFLPNNLPINHIVVQYSLDSVWWTFTVHLVLKSCDMSRNDLQQFSLTKRKSLYFLVTFGGLPKWGRFSTFLVVQIFCHIDLAVDSDIFNNLQISQFLCTFCLNLQPLVKAQY